jgi:hypothetical protein
MSAEDFSAKSKVLESFIEETSVRRCPSPAALRLVSPSSSSSKFGIIVSVFILP